MQYAWRAHACIALGKPHRLQREWEWEVIHVGNLNSRCWHRVVDPGSYREGKLVGIFDSPMWLWGIAVIHKLLISGLIVAGGGEGNLEKFMDFDKRVRCKSKFRLSTREYCLKVVGPYPAEQGFCDVTLRVPSLGTS